MKKTILILGAILILATGLRLYQLGSTPPGLTWDEASLGWNSYSILHTGRDEYGSLLPLTLKSFGDYKPALYAYYALPSIAILGLNEFSTRLPSALFGVVSVLLIYLLVRKLFHNESLGLVAAFVLAVSPWHLQYSRGAWEANCALTLVLAAVYCFYRGLEKWQWLVASLVFFVATFYTYQSSRLFVPLLILGLLIIHRGNFWPFKKVFFVPIILGLIILLPYIVSFLNTRLLFSKNFVYAFLNPTVLINPQTSARLKVESMFSYTRPDTETITLAKEEHTSTNSAQFRLFHSQKELWVRAIIEREVNDITPAYLFVTGDTGERQHTPGVAVEYWAWIPFYFLGFYFLAKSHVDRKVKALVLFWLLISPLPAILSRDSTTSLRSLQEIFAVDTIIALGIFGSYQALRRIRLFWLLSLLVFFFFFFNFCFYLDSYYVHLPKRLSQYWLYGYKQAITAIEPIYQQYNGVVMTTDKNEPYIYVLFYLKPDPRIVQQQIHLTATRGIDVGEVQKFGKFQFRHIYWPDDRGTAHTLFIGTEEELPKQDIDPKQSRLITTIPYLDGSSAFKIVETLPKPTLSPTPNNGGKRNVL